MKLTPLESFERIVGLCGDRLMQLFNKRVNIIWWQAQTLHALLDEISLTRVNVWVIFYLLAFFGIFKNATMNSISYCPARQPILRLASTKIWMPLELTQIKNHLHTKSLPLYTSLLVHLLVNILGFYFFRACQNMTCWFNRPAVIVNSDDRHAAFA